MAIAIYSDGGSDSGQRAAGACIIESTDNRWGIVAYLGKATNNEAEITAALLGFAFVKQIIADNKLEQEKIVWTADSEYTLKSATEYIWRWQKNGWLTANKEPVKNQGLWRSYLNLTQGLKVEPKHVRGHTGHLQNEASDHACNWVKSIEIQNLKAGAQQIEITANPCLSTWLLINAQPFITVARTDASGEQIALCLSEQLSMTPQSIAQDPYRFLKTKLEAALSEAQTLDYPPAITALTNLLTLLRGPV
ncbi:MAG: hypothetical protein IT292_06625 [Deltaproteobacteria bacterium]|nr:hypothetical protein [Deltaproteobacteria bacterium]